MNAREFLDLRSLPAEEPALVGVSGGRDSVALLHLLLQAGLRNLVVCHLNHRLRPESGKDAAFVQALAEEKGLPVEMGETEVRALAEKEKCSLEVAARIARQRFLAECSRKHGYPNVFLGHHARDQAETLLINLLRGSGPAGLAGMSRLSSLEVDGRELIIIRPLLHRTPEEIQAFPGVSELPFQEDSSNSSEEFFRNRVRHQIMPVLEKAAQREITRTLCRTAAILREEDLLLAEEAGKKLGKVRQEDGSLDAAMLRSESVAMQRRVIHMWLKGEEVRDIGFELVESVRSLLEVRPPAAAKVNLPAGHHVRRRNMRVFVERV